MFQLKFDFFLRKLISALIFIIVFNSVKSDRTKDKIYEDIHGSMCFRRLNATHQVGCSSAGKSAGSVGALHYISNTNDINFLLENPPAPPYAAIITPHYFTREIVLKLRDSRFVSALILINDTSRAANFSQESNCPNQYFAHSNQPHCDASKPETTWNPFGSGLLQENFDIPIMFLSDKKEIDKIIKCYEDFNSDLKSQSRHSLCSVEINSFMSAAGNSEICMRRTDMPKVFNQVHYCDPLQGKNIYATLFSRDVISPANRTNDKNEKIVLITTRLDTTSGFDGVGLGALDSLTSIATLIASGHFLKKIIPNDISGGRANFNVMFMLFNGETYDFIGSQRFVYDLKKGDAFPTPLSYTRPLNLDNVIASIDIGPLDGFTDLSMYLRQDSSFADIFIKNAQKYSQQFNLNIKIRKEVTENIPPVSTQSFLRENATFPAFAISTNKPTNKFYHSVFDDTANIDYHYHNVTRDFDQLDVTTTPTEFNETSVQIKIRNIASIIAMSLYEILTKNEYKDKNLASSAFIDEFLYCFLIASNCKLNRASYEFPESFHASETAPNRYVSVQGSILLEATVWSYQIMAYALSDKIVDVAKENCTVKPFIWIPGSKMTGECRLTTHNFSLALSPAFEGEDYDFTSNRYSTWTESTWNSLSARMFLRPSATHESLTFSIGFVTMLLSFVIVYLINAKSEVLFGEVSVEHESIPVQC